MSNKAKVLIYDIETAPNLAYVWGKYQQDVIQFKEEWELLSFAFKWLGEKETIAYGRDQYTEEQLVKKLHKLFDISDVIIAHNGDSFDQRMSHAKFIEFGLLPPSPYRQVDTKKVAKKYFRLNSNKLDDIGARLGLGRKVQTGGFSLWLGCMANDPKAWRKMLTYNKQDVKLLERIYLRLRPWIDNHPSMNIYGGKPDACPKCGKGPMQSRGTRKVNKSTTYRRFQCQSCGGWSTSRRSDRTDVLYVN